MGIETIERTFTVGTPAQVRIANIRGQVHVQAGEDGLVHITAVKHPEDGDSGRTEVCIGQGGDGQVWAETRFHGRRWHLFGTGRPARVDYTVHVPRDCHLRVAVVSSSIHVEGLRGQIELHSVSGDMTLDDLGDQIEVQTVSGDARGQNLAGRARLKAISGRIHVNASHLTAAEAETVSGDIALEMPLGEGPYRFKSVSGDVRLVVPAASAGTVIGKSVSGRARLALPVTASEHSRGHWRYEVQGGGPEVRFESVSGDLHIGVAEEVEPCR